MRLFDLVIASKGLKLSKAERKPVFRYPRSFAGNTTLPRLADALSLVLQTPVVDRTNTPGLFELKVTWESDGSPPTAAILSEALQREAGLRLEARKEPMEMLVIDSADRIPKEN